MFPDRCKKTYVELGAFQPIQWSNSIYLRKKGWTGISYDPNPHLGILWRIFRPGDELISKVVTPKHSENGSTLFYFMETGVDGTSSISIDHVETHAKRFGVSYRSEWVSSLSIEQILDNFISKNGKPPDLLLIDIEGLDNEVLRSLCTFISRKKLPRWIFMEVLDEKLVEAKLICKEKYDFVGSVGPNIMLSLRE